LTIPCTTIKRFYLAVFGLMLALFTFAPLSALDFSFRPRPFLFIPLGEPAKTRFDLGGGASLLFDVDLSSIDALSNPLGIGYTAGLEAGLNYSPFSGAEGNTQFYSLGGGLSAYYFPLPRLLTRIDAGLGAFTGASDGSRSPGSFWWRLGGEAGFRFTPGFILSAALGGQQYISPNGGAMQGGMYIGLTAQINIETGSGKNNGLALAAEQDEGVYPVFLSLYQNNPAAILRITNRESAEIRDVRVSFRAAGYTSSEFPCGSVALIGKGRSEELPLLADFSPAVLGFHDQGRIVGEVVIRYTLLGRERSSVQTAAVQVYNRNSFPQVDASALAAFVSPTSPEVLEYAKYITGMARNNLQPGLNQNMQFAVWLFEGLKAGGIKIEDASPSLVELQFPAETLGYHTGSAADAGLLFAASLEASGIRAALIPLEGEFITAVSLGINQAAAASLFNGAERLLIVDDEVWIPLAMSALEAGFISAWNKAIAALDNAFAQDEDTHPGHIDFIILEDSWETYPPAPLPSQGMTFNPPAEAATVQPVNAAIGAYITRELRPLIAALNEEIRRSPSAALYNRLGLVYMRLGQNPEAKTNFERAAGMGSVAAMANRGNMALAEKDLTAAERWFKQAAAAAPENAAAQRGLEQVESQRR
jgi:tetratricopeptide (TPR) repeat protein